ncbi:MAG: hypothetical protein NTW16_02680, partial [Bacteroidetes bacterium]|nr:hypothetical protein [Bacteroidota bacterium]
VYTTAYTFSGGTAGTASEVVSNPATGTAGNANCGPSATGNSKNIGGPLRVGSFSTGTSDRIISGATCYGIMEMSGNVWEYLVTAGKAEGRAFSGTHGNGVLTTGDEADLTTWPNTSSAVGTGARGGNFYDPVAWMGVSNRDRAAQNLNARYMSVGGRGVRRAFTIGQSFGGGIIFYLDATGQHGLIAAPSDQRSCAQWGCPVTFIGGTSTLPGTGKANTTIIVNGCNEADIAAKICNDLELNGYDDWFFPSKDELDLMYQQKTVVGGFSESGYICSSEADQWSAWTLYTFDGTWNNYLGKIGEWGYCAVRAVRAF